MLRLPAKFGGKQQYIKKSPIFAAIKDEVKYISTEPLTIAYFTCRNDPKIEWFFRTLNRELNGNWNNIFIIIIDYHYQYKPEERYEQFKKHYEMYTTNVKHVSPKPCPLQGKYKITTENYFAASNARNTAFINCETSYIVCIDDLTILKEGWLDVVKWGQKNNYVIYGSYAKVKNIECSENGSYSFDKSSIYKGLDSRYNDLTITNDFATQVAGSWLFGCSFAMPLEIAYDVDGFDEACDGQSAEDYDFGVRVGRVTKDIYYSRTMFTYEDDDLHFTPGNVGFKRTSILLTEDTLLKKKIGIMSDHAILQNLLESDSKLPLLPSNLKRTKELYNEDEIKLTENFKDFRDWRNGKLWSDLLIN